MHYWKTRACGSVAVALFTERPRSSLLENLGFRHTGFSETRFVEVWVSTPASSETGVHSRIVALPPAWVHSSYASLPGVLVGVTSSAAVLPWTEVLFPLALGALSNGPQIGSALRALDSVESSTTVLPTCCSLCMVVPFPKVALGSRRARPGLPCPSLLPSLFIITYKARRYVVELPEFLSR